jgi:hypothetical protein
MKKSFLPAGALLLSILVMGPANGQQQKFACPRISPDLRQRALSRMMGFAREGRMNGCQSNPDAPLDVDCHLVLQFKIETGTFTFNLPWSGLVACFPELSPIQSINAQAIMRNAETKKETEKKADRERQDEHAKNNDPKHLLIRTYYDYIIIKRCFDQRQGYAAVNISDQEMANAKQFAKTIEDSVQKVTPSIDKELAWKIASSDSEDWMTPGDKTELILSRYNNQFELDKTDRNRCQKILAALETRSKKLAPEANTVEKDF